METFSDLIEAIRKPFAFLSKVDFKKIDSLKDIDSRTISLAEKGLCLTNEPQKRNALKELIVLFQKYPSLDPNQRKTVIEKSISILESFSKPLDAYLKQTKFYDGNAHRIASAEEFLKNEEKLDQNVQYLKGVGPKVAAKLATAGIFTVGDILYFFPRRYEDRRKMQKINELVDGQKATFMGEVSDIHTVYYRGRGRGILELDVEDETGLIKAKWFNFNKAYFEGKVRMSQQIIFTGKVRVYKGRREIYHPEFEVLGKSPADSLSFGKVVPVYSEVGGLYQKTLRKIMFNAVRNYSKFRLCTLPDEICSRFNLLSPAEALLEIHCPDKRMPESGPWFV